MRTSGAVRCTATFPSVGAAWTAMLGSEDVLRAVRLVGETPVRHAFAESVAGAVTPAGAVRLPKTFRYTVATVGLPTSWATCHQLDNESGSVADRPGGRD